MLLSKVMLLAWQIGYCFLSTNISKYSGCLKENWKNIRSVSALSRRPTSYILCVEGEPLPCTKQREESYPTLVPRLLNSIDQVSKEQWNQLLSDESCPFTEYEWLYGLEKCGCVCKETGWQPLHLVLEEPNSKIVYAALPLYIKYHSMGEFIFDYIWQDIAATMSFQYYPKLLSMVPFTPVTSRRVLTISELLRPHLLSEISQCLKDLVEESSIESVHLNFVANDEVSVFTRYGFLHRKSVQYRFLNDCGGRPFQNFDEFLGKMKSKKRIQLKRERRRIYEEEKIRLEVLLADEIPKELFRQMYQLYKSTIDRFFYGRLYLNPSFFYYLEEHYRKYLCFVLAYREDQLVAGTFNLIKNGRFHGRYWGCFEQVSGLHFETCYYKPIEYCIERGLRSVEPGAGGGDFKFVRGFDPFIVHSLHYFKNEGLANVIKSFVEEESRHVDYVCSRLSEQSALRKSNAS